MRYALILQYNGANYHGWQRQNGQVSVQGTLIECFSNVLRKTVEILGCGRTDTGVHAKNYVAYFDYDSMTCEQLDKLKTKINSYLPFDIRINHIVEVSNDFNARFDALSRTYRYYVTNIKQPFDNDFCWFVPHKLDIRSMNTAARILYQYDDFTSFSKLGTQVNNNVCRILYAHWNKQNEYLVFTIKANRFLRNMVRAIVGTLVNVGKGKISADDFSYIISSRDRSNASSSAPAKGLFLEEVEYDSQIFKHKLFVI